MFESHRILGKLSSSVLGIKSERIKFHCITFCWPWAESNVWWKQLLKDGKFEAESKKSWEFLGALFQLLKPELLQLLSQLHLADLSRQTLFFCHCLLSYTIFFCFICSLHTGFHTCYKQGICQFSFCKTNLLDVSYLSKSVLLSLKLFLWFLTELPLFSSDHSVDSIPVLWFFWDCTATKHLFKTAQLVS